jgi:hypothetical protein
MLLLTQASGQKGKTAVGQRALPTQTPEVTAFRLQEARMSEMLNFYPIRSNFIDPFQLSLLDPKIRMTNEARFVSETDGAKETLEPHEATGQESN